MKKFIIILFWIILWHILAVITNNNILLVGPLDVAVRLSELVCNAAFWQAAMGTLLRIGIGFGLGVTVALILAVFSFRCSLAEEVLQPVIGLMKTVPVASFVVIFLIWWGASNLSVAISLLVVLPNIYISTLEGLQAADKRLLEMGKVFGFGLYQRFMFIYRPALRPFLVSAMKLALGMCWKSGVAAEVIGMPEHSIGGELYLSKIYLDTSGVLGWTAVIIFLSWCFETLMLKLVEQFFAWIPVNMGRRKMNLSEGINAIQEEGCLILEGVSKSFGQTQVLKEISQYYEQGKVYYLNSPSGSGKTTLLRLLCGLEKPDCGRISGAHSFSMVFQENRLCEEYSAVQNVMMVVDDEERARQVLGKLLEQDALDKPCKQLSGGMKRRVALVRAMEAESQVVLLDEPFTGMDAHTRREAEKYIRERQRGRILVIATHI